MDLGTLDLFDPLLNVSTLNRPLFFLFIESCLYSWLRKRVDKVLLGDAGVHPLTLTILEPI